MSAIVATAESSSARMALAVTTDTAGLTYYVFRRDSAGTNVVRETSEGDRVTDGAAHATVYDYEARQGEPTDYLLTDGDGGVLATVRVTIPEWGTWLKSPGRPVLNAKTHFNDEEDVKRAAERTLLQIEGSSVPVPLASRRRAAQGSVSFACLSIAEMDALKALLADGQVLMLDVPGSYDVRFRYISVGDVAEKRLWHENGLEIEKRLLVLSDVAEVAAPLGTYSGSSTWTYAQIPTVYGTYAAIPASVATYDALAAG